MSLAGPSARMTAVHAMCDRSLFLAVGVGVIVLL
jgi:hypothetical protein